MFQSKKLALLRTILLALVLPALSSAEEVASEVTERVNDLPGTPVRAIAVSDTVTKIDGSLRAAQHPSLSELSMTGLRSVVAVSTLLGPDPR